MASEKPHGGSALESLPNELIIAILSSVADLPTLENVVFSSRKLYAVFRSSKNVILRSVWKNHIGPELIEDLLATVESGDYRPEAEYAWMTHICRPWQTLPEQLIPEAVIRSTAKLSTAVKGLADLFVDYVAENYPEQTGLPQDISRTERTRIERAFYRFELFRNLHRYTSLDYTRNHWIRLAFAYFKHLPPWELTQVGCIHDFLFYLIKENHLTRSPCSCPACHWVVCDACKQRQLVTGINLYNTLQFGCSSVQFVLTKGLEQLYSVVTATKAATTEAQREVIRRDYMEPVMRDDFFYVAFRMIMMPQVMFYETRPEDDYRDSDSGPRYACLWADDQGASRFPSVMQSRYCFQHESIRRWGYPFWDRTRLNKLVIMSKVFKSSYCASYLQECEKAETTLSWTSMPIQLMYDNMEKAIERFL